MEKHRKKRKLPKKLLVRYGELWLIRDALEQKFLIGQGSISDRITYSHVLEEISEIRKSLRS